MMLWLRYKWAGEGLAPPENEYPPPHEAVSPKRRRKKGFPGAGVPQCEQRECWGFAATEAVAKRLMSRLFAKVTFARKSPHRTYQNLRIHRDRLPMSDCAQGFRTPPVVYINLQFIKSHQPHLSLRNFRDRSPIRDCAQVFVKYRGMDSLGGQFARKKAGGAA